MAQYMNGENDIHVLNNLFCFVLFCSILCCFVQGDAIELEAENGNENANDNNPSDRDEGQQRNEKNQSQGSDSEDSPGDGKASFTSGGGRFKIPTAEKPHKTAPKAAGGGGSGTGSASGKKRKGDSADRLVEKKTKTKGSAKGKAIRKCHAPTGTMLDWTSKSLPRTPYGVPLLLSCLSTHPDKVCNE